MPEHYALMFRRQFDVGDAGDMLGLSHVVFVAAADELRALSAELHGDDRGDPELFAAAADDWIAQVEASPAFMIPMTRHQALRFSFGVDGIGRVPPTEHRVGVSARFCLRQKQARRSERSCC
jgi:hypothetical protein